MTKRSVKLPNPPPHLQGLGFIYDPFGYAEAEKMPDDAGLWERLFVEHPGFDQIQNLEKSAVLLAERGGGKTAHRLRFAQKLKLRPDWLVVTYDSFELIIQKLPNIKTSDHFKPLMACVAKALLCYIKQPHNKERFLEDKDMPLADRRWCWAFIKAYLGYDLQFELDDDLRSELNYLETDYIGSPIQSNTPLARALNNIREHIHPLGISRLFILIDGVDGLNEFVDFTSMTALVNPLLNGLSLLSIPGVVWKFFLPKLLEPTVLESSGCRTGRLHPVPIEWDHESLVQFLNSRLKWASKQFDQPSLYQRVEDLCSQELSARVKVEKELTKMALSHPYLGPPRTLLQLTSQLVSQSAFRNGRISPEDWEKFHQSVHQ